MRIFTVLKTGDGFKNRKVTLDYRIEHVQWLKSYCDRFAPGIEFVCLTNEPSIPGVKTLPLTDNYTGWWSKIELFKYSDVFYMDLDTLLVGRIDDMIHAITGEFYALENMSGHRNETTGNILMGSGIMAWRSNEPLIKIYEQFTMGKTEAYTKSFKRWGDQGYILDIRGDGNFIGLQSNFPNRIYSYKFNKIDLNVLPATASIIVFHGQPKPWEVDIPVNL